ncbi:MAG TPA: NAD(P)/FAD-dependent oxidoreductase [Actinomycetota bacterium]|nr:NAD(P)/FAD-dependent oxidoreductase [Actinomycetota bacterium]
MRVCVIGAGFAGLVAAATLAERGVEPLVVEARNRVGGRVLSQQLANDAVAERGAEFAEPRHRTITSVAEQLGLALAPLGIRAGEREPRGGAGTTLEAVRAEVARLERLVEERRDRLAGRSVSQFLAELPLDPGASEAIACRLQVTWACPVEELAASVLDHLGAAFSGEESLRVVGGNQRIALRLAERLGPALRLGSPAEAVHWSAAGVQVRAAGDWASADACVVAVPASVLDRVRFDPPLPEWKAAALARVVYGHAAKLVVPLARPAPPSAVLSVPERFWTWTARGADGRVQPVVSAFAGSAPALERLRVDTGPAGWLQRLRALRPDLALEERGAILATWSDDPWSRGAYSTRPVAGRLDDDELLARPVGRLHFAGEHTAGRWAGAMEGALRSGLRAAAEVSAARGQGVA